MNIHYNKPIDCSAADRQRQNSRMLLKAVGNAFPKTKISNIFDGGCHQTSTKHRSEYTTGISSPSRQEQTVNSLYKGPGFGSTVFSETDMRTQCPPIITF